MTKTPHEQIEELARLARLKAPACILRRHAERVVESLPRPEPVKLADGPEKWSVL